MNDELIEVFVEEGRELVEQANHALGQLREGADAAVFDALFRAFHTLKGSAGLMGFDPMAKLFHAGEDRLSAARAGGGVLNQGLIDALTAILDQTEVWLEATALADAIPAGGQVAAAELAEQLAALDDQSSDQNAPAIEARTGSGLVETPGAARTLRVEASRLDDLAAAADELAVLKNQMGELTARAARMVGGELGRELGKAQAELDRQALRLHAATTRLRVTPLGPLFRRFPRLVRETAASLGKNVELTLAGGDVEVDKTVVDGLFEPLLHLVRNALDHGVEPPEARRAAGKPERGRLSLSAQAIGDQAIIEVADDGRGVDPATVRRVAIDRGVVSEEAAERMDEAASVNLIFAPGFSTARAVGELSGRGVGLDAVRVAVASLGGRVSMTSEVGRGARFSIALPLNVRLARIMTVEAGGATFGVPLESIVETAYVDANRLTPVRAGRAFTWRDQAAPLLELADLLDLPPPPPREAFKVLLVRAGGDVAAISVDAFGDRLEAPVRPMTGLLAGAAGIAGSTLAADGRVLMVLDLPELIG